MSNCTSGDGNNASLKFLVFVILMGAADVVSLKKAVFSMSVLTFRFQLIITVFFEKSIKISKGLSLLLGRKVMTNLDSILKSRDITLPTKVRLVKAMVFPVVMYGCESWTVKKAEC